MVVFTSGIVDERPPGGVGVLLVLSCLLLTCGGWVGRGTWGCRVWWGVLTHCWALRDQTLVGLRGPRRPVGWWALVGMDLVNWIVDASICGGSSPGPSLFDAAHVMCVVVRVFVVFVGGFWGKL